MLTRPPGDNVRLVSETFSSRCAIFPGVPKQYKSLGLALGALGWDRVCAVCGPGRALRDPTQVRGGTGTRALGAVVAPAPVPLCKEPSGAAGDPLSLHRLKRRELNCYMYAPKDELKHRLLWREPYTEHEAGRGSAGPRTAAAGSAGEARSAPQPGSGGLLPLFLPRTCPLRATPDPAGARSLPDPIARHCPQAHPAQGAPHGALAICLNVPGPGDHCREPSISQGAGNSPPGISRCSLLPHDALRSFLLGHCGSISLLPALTAPTLSPARMRSLIEAAQEQGVEFVFAISAGQDMVFSSAGDRLLLQQKLRQVPWSFLPPAGQRAQELVREPHAHPKGWRGL